MANPPTNKVPPRTSTKGGGNRPGTRPAPPRPPRKPPKRRSGRSAGRFYTILVTVLALIVAVVVIVVVTSSGGGSKAKQTAANYTTATGVKIYGAVGPEGVPIEEGTQLGAPNTGLTGSPIDGVPCNNSEQLTYHHHAHLMIFVNGQPKYVPIGVGFVPPAQVEQTSTGEFAVAAGADCLYWLHVHAQDGILHIESPTPKTFQLSQFFAIWHQALSATQVGPYKGQVTATVNGAPWTGDPTQIPLGEHTQVVINVGGPIITPPPINWSATSL